MVDDLMTYIPRCTNSPNRDNKESLAMAYIPMQKWQKIYSGEVAMNRGTLFAELDKPFIGEEAVSNG